MMKKVKRLSLARAVHFAETEVISPRSVRSDPVLSVRLPPLQTSAQDVCNRPTDGKQLEEHFREDFYVCDDDAHCAASPSEAPLSALDLVRKHFSHIKSFLEMNFDQESDDG